MLDWKSLIREFQNEGMRSFNEKLWRASSLLIIILMDKEKSGMGEGERRKGKRNLESSRWEGEGEGEYRVGENKRERDRQWKEKRLGRYKKEGVREGERRL